MKIRTACLSTLLLVGAAFRVYGQNQVYVEMRVYTCSSAEKRDALMAVFDRALIPALNRQGVTKAGVYSADSALNNDRQELDTLLYTVAAFPTLEALAACEERLLADAAYMREAAALFSAPMKDPLYDSCRSSVLRTFRTCPEVVQVAKSPGRILQLRIYNSFTIERNASKIAMFEGGGEIQLFRDAGMPPVFFGHALSGELLPNLTYILSFENQEEQKKAWSSFINSEGWKKLKAEPQYKDTANKITNIILKPSPNSQL